MFHSNKLFLLLPNTMDMSLPGATYVSLCVCVCLWEEGGMSQIVCFHDELRSQHPYRETIHVSGGGIAGLPAAGLMSTTGLAVYPDMLDSTISLSSECKNCSCKPWDIIIFAQELCSVLVVGSVQKLSKTAWRVHLYSLKVRHFHFGRIILRIYERKHKCVRVFL